jgi:hypothetical protein
MLHGQKRPGQNRTEQSIHPAAPLSFPQKRKRKRKKKNQMSHIRTDDLINICVTGRVRHNKNWKQDASCSLKKGLKTHSE